jgi:hypothetical protein
MVLVVVEVIDMDDVDIIRFVAVDNITRESVTQAT